jgi:broad specificity phosphatase PhoE
MNRPNKILLIRHCTPEINYSKCGYIEATQRIHEYNTTKKIATEEILSIKPHIEAFLEMQHIAVFASSMPRALITAQTLFHKKYTIVGEDRFIEFDLRFIPIPFIQLKFGTWALISRILWFGGMLKTKRSVKLELNRAKDASNFLYKQAKQANIALVSHGMLNIFIEKNLKKLGYKRASKVKNSFLTVITLECDAKLISKIQHEIEAAR